MPWQCGSRRHQFRFQDRTRSRSAARQIGSRVTVKRREARGEGGYPTIFHDVDLDESRRKNGWEDTWKKRYTAGIMLLDAEDPGRIIGISKEPLMVPEADYEASNGFRNNVVFPAGAILEDTGEVKIYYGAADTVECLATAHVDDLLRLCLS